MASTVSGKNIRNARHNKCKMTERQFAKYLHQKTGENITARKVARMENYKEKDACNPLRPSKAVGAVIQEINSTDSDTEESEHFAENNENSSEEDYTKGHKQDAGGVASMIEEQDQDLTKMIALYRELGIFDTPGDTATEIMQNIQTDIHKMKWELWGRQDSVKLSEKESNTNLEDAKKELQKLEKQEADLKAQLERINSQLQEYETSSSANTL
ncbi:MAG: hypothetical protein AB4060_14080 [Crocosphaera sp.]